MTIGGLIEIDEDPVDAAVREAAEEAGVKVEIGQLVAAQGGPQYRLDYPNGDRAAYVSVVYEAEVVEGSPTPDGKETDLARWISLAELESLELSVFAQAQFKQLGWL